MSRSTQDIKNAPRASKIALILKHFPNAKLKGNKIVVGNVAGDEGESLSYYPDQDYYRDYAASGEKGGNAAKLLSEKMNITYNEALSLVRRELGLESQTSPSNARRTLREALIPVPEGAPPPGVVVGSPHYSKAGFFVRAIYPYLDTLGRRMWLVCRFEGPELMGKGKPEKLVLPYTYRVPEGWGWKGPGLPQNPLYGLDRLAARPDAYVLLVEGEKAADAAAALFPDYVAITWMGGTGQVGKADFSPLCGKIVVYWPDNDEPGVKSVEIVAQKLAEVGVAELRVVRLPPHLPKGWDVADEAPSGLDPRAILLAAALHVPESALFRDFSFEELLGRLVYVNETEQFVDCESGYRTQSSQLNALCRHTRKGMAQLLLEDPRLQKAVRFSYLPGDSRRIIREEHGLQSFNLWRPSEVTPKAGDATVFVEHLRNLCTTDEEFEHLADMLAFMVQRPGVKLMSAVVLIGSPGTGKSFVGYVMRMLLGSHNTADVRSEDIKEKYNAYLEAKLLVVVEEIMALGRIEIMNTLKPYITQLRIRIQQKFVRSYEIDNRANFIFLSNYMDALKLDRGDRRYFIIGCQKPPKAPEYFARLWAWETQNRGVILSWLLARDLSGFDPNARPPETEGKLSMIEASRDDTEVLLAELIEARARPFEYDLVELADMQAVFCNGTPGTQTHLVITRSSLLRALRAVGAVSFGQLRGGGDSARRRPSLWAVRNVERYLKMPPKAIVDEYKKQRQGLGCEPAPRTSDIDL